MKLFLLTQEVENGWDTFDSMIVAAKNEKEARLITPPNGEFGRTPYTCWAHSPEQVQVKLIGTAVKDTPAGIVLASFNAG